jgi:transglutaminase-like putative cysteine protease
MGLVLLRESKEQAMEQGWGESPDITAATAIRVDTTFAAPGLSYLKLRLSGVALDGFALNEGRQRFADGVLEIRLEQPPPEAAAAAPPRGMDDYLRPTPFIQSDDPDIVKTAAHVSRGGKGAAAVVRLLNSWVYTTLKKAPTLSIPSAVAVLKSRQGDCNEHAVLLAALCRAAGVPARVAAGLVHLNGSFFYHAWCEVYAGGWISVDPSMNQFPADVSHLKFVGGETDSQIALLRLIGKLHIEVLEYL